MFLILCLSLLLTFSFKIVEIIIRIPPLRKLEKYTVILWAIIILIAVPFFNETYVLKMPLHYDRAFPIFGFLILVNVIASRFSGYNPIGKYNIINFLVTYPIIEEIVFRGLILHNIKQFFSSSEIIQVLYMPVTIPIIFSAFLFAICHLQYYSLSALSVRFMILAFLGGIMLGAMAEMTESILYALILHIVFNSFSVFFAKRALLKSYSRK